MPRSDREQIQLRRHVLINKMAASRVGVTCLISSQNTLVCSFGFPLANLDRVEWDRTRGGSEWLEEPRGHSKEQHLANAPVFSQISHRAKITQEEQENGSHLSLVHPEFLRTAGRSLLPT